MNYELNGNELKFNWNLTKSELKLNKKLGTWMNIQMYELHGINIYDNKKIIFHNQKTKIYQFFFW